MVLLNCPAVGLDRRSSCCASCSGSEFEIPKDLGLVLQKLFQDFLEGEVNPSLKMMDYQPCPQDTKDEILGISSLHMFVEIISEGGSATE